MPEAVFDVVAKNPQVKHVAEQVQPPFVQEHAGEEGVHEKYAGTSPNSCQTS